jgi:hypothetical protein
MENYKAEAVFCPNDKKCETKVIPGKWTSIYDQAMNVELDNGMRFIANFRYNVIPDLSKDPLADGSDKFDNEIPDSELPENFDWRNIKGVDFTNPHRDQGHCGSCYTVSFTQIAE